MKARIKGITTTKTNDGSYIIEADSIEIIDEPKKREVRAWNVNADDKRTEIVIPTQDGLKSFCLSGDCCRSENGICKGFAVLGLSDNARCLFNLLDLVTEMQKVKDKTEVFQCCYDPRDSIFAESYSTGVVRVTIRGLTIKTVNLPFADARRFAAQLLGLAVGKE